MNVVIRADASTHIGSGHVMRCLVLALGLVEQGHQVSFVCRPQTGDLIEFIEHKGFTVHLLASPQTWLEPQHSADYVAWLQVPWQEDAQNLLMLVAVADLVIVDHYALNKDWQQQIKQALDCKVMVIDDLVREHAADLILDQTLLRLKSEYQATDDTKLLTGCDFALLNPRFSDYRQHALANDILCDRPKLLLSMGGSDQPNATLSVLTALAKMPTLSRPLVTVLLGPRAPHYQQVKAFCLQHDDWITHLDFVDDMAELMSQQQVAIGAPGTTSWERACLGLPSIIVPLADNQQTISRNLVAVDAAYKLELDEIAEHLLSSYQRLLQNWSQLRGNNLRLCDGLGLKRVLTAIGDFTGACHLQLRAATGADIKLVFDWQCQPSTRQYALNKQLPTWAEHNKWMTDKLLQQQDYFYIIEIANSVIADIEITDTEVENSEVAKSEVVKNEVVNRSGNQLDSDHISVGVVRLDKITKAEYLLSIFIDPAYYSQGIAKRALAYLDALHPRITIHAQVLTANLASQQLFTQAGYQRLSAESFIRYPQA
ncbi:UDP-2,4-diacetamido-2,4,6-trideoxy-beta-L-altropyranose hydrolase [Moritella sp. Urea-trap-13]|uniref:UDP-2,4-diacetamido-2,4, 6-trideoxy-beta-L-altropyranose hydrolase n=1 Tax=Moritella sp. Urea-trap-13 TaxID=2058327 RepID=UPI000C3242DD|nr:UDP-2,4-diacetamido-2,4,6-trideoxy-beta-L-altropyranose hydrolase [Moritella sp. Urea-trap-13]PKH05283.1 UDP-2,4-diacetamido-2,4,6-trideoxy-beta-L-altropyranose hydrolase [Moritella sp. Urea-trap-13]